MTQGRHPPDYRKRNASRARGSDGEHDAHVRQADARASTESGVLEPEVGSSRILRSNAPSQLRDGGHDSDVSARELGPECLGYLVDRDRANSFSRLFLGYRDVIGSRRGPAASNDSISRFTVVMNPLLRRGRGGSSSLWTLLGLLCSRLKTSGRTMREPAPSLAGEIEAVK